MDAIRTALGEFWSTLTTMSPYLLFGFAVAGVLSALIPASLVQRHLGGRGLWPVIKSSLFGVPLPLCSCGVIPVSMSLHKNGASKAATVAFLLSTPQTGLDNILVTWGMLGPVFAVVSPIMALVTGLAGGVLTNLWDPRPAPPAPEPKACGCHSKPEAPKAPNRWLAALHHGFVALPADIGKPLFFGVLVAAGISMLIPDRFFSEQLGTGVVPMIVMMGVGIPLYVCTTASIPVAAAMILKGLSPGAALVFLMTGPVTNAAGIATIWRALGARAASAYLVAVAGCALAGGLLLDWAVGYVDLPVGAHVHSMPNPWLGALSAVVLTGLIVHALFVQRKASP
ncbi:MAG: SO_0444 family Cu/Zn efflux transporter [Phycisphaerae bacterium]|nr:SO_0444 family Cu/Zn efflux transporter [Phycisphaerae bacterium]